MRSRSWLVGSLVAVSLLLVGAAGAFAASPSSTTAGSFLADVASHLGVTPAALQTAIQQSQMDRVQKLVQSGKITQAQAQALETRIKSGTARLCFCGPGHFHHMMGARASLGLSTAATYLGVSSQELRQSLAGGSSLAQIAQSKGKSVQGLQDALLSAMQGRIAKAVANGRLTQDRAKAIEAALPGRIAKFVTRSGFGRAPNTTNAPAN